MTSRGVAIVGAAETAEIGTVAASIDLRNCTIAALSAGLVSVSTPLVPALRWVTLLSTSSRFISEFASMVHAASVAGSIVATAFISPTVRSFAASAGWLL